MKLAHFLPTRRIHTVNWTFLLTAVSLAFFSGFLTPVHTGIPSLHISTSYHISTQHKRTLSAGIATQATSQVKVLGIESRMYTPTPIPDKPQSDLAWGQARQVDEHTWTVRLGNDDHMATPDEIFTALNNYRVQHGRGRLTWDSGLAGFAQSRATLFTQKGTTDKHEGFLDFVNNQDGFTKLGFFGLGENSSVGYKLAGVHIIEWMYAADSGHNDNQLSSQWSHVGIGVDGLSTDLIFGGNKQ